MFTSLLSSPRVSLGGGSGGSGGGDGGLGGGGGGGGDDGSSGSGNDGCGSGGSGGGGSGNGGCGSGGGGSFPSRHAIFLGAEPPLPLKHIHGLPSFPGILHRNLSNHHSP